MVKQFKTLKADYTSCIWCEGLRQMVAFQQRYEIFYFSTQHTSVAAAHIMHNSCEAALACILTFPTYTLLIGDSFSISMGRNIC